MRLLLALLATVAGAGAAAAAGTPGVTTSNFRLDEVVVAENFNGGECTSLDGTPTTVQVPKVGRATLSFHASRCLTFGPPDADGHSITYDVTHLDVTLATAKGDVLVLGSPQDVVEAETPGQPPDPGALSSGDWTVKSASGRFAGYSGSGTYTATYTPPFPPGVPPFEHDAHLVFEGHLSPSAH
jgi:hypothetical protein